MNKSFNVFYLNFNAPLHLGNYRPDEYDQSESFLRSDTLVAAVYATWAKMGKEDLIPKNGDPPFTLSSAFPFWSNPSGQKVHFFPRPKVPFKKEEQAAYDASLAKALKKIKWLDQEHFQLLIANKSIGDGVGLKSKLKDDFLTNQVIPENGFMVKEEMQRVTIPRNREVAENADATPFYMERIRFQNAGLFFIAEGDDLTDLKSALDLLQYEGFGTDRNIGNGLFDLDHGTITLDLPDNTDYALNLSLYCPNSQSDLNSQLDENARFDLIKRGGWITTPGLQTIEKNSIYMFSEGSVFKQQGTVNGKGDIDLKPNSYPIGHSIFRSGKAIFLPITLQL